MGSCFFDIPKIISPQRFFTFAVASTEYHILKEYVLETLKCQLKQETDDPEPETAERKTETNRRKTDVRDVHIRPDCIDCSDVEQGSISLQNQIIKYLRVESIRDLLDDNRKDNLTIVLWFANPVAENFQRIATRFSKTLEAQVTNILHDRYLVLFWANYGSRPIESSNMIVLPTLKQFNVEHVTFWANTKYRDQLKRQHIPEQEIKYYVERLIEEIEDHRGDLLGTFACLQNSLSLDKRQKGAILPDSVDFVQAHNCQMDLTHALESGGTH